MATILRVGKANDVEADAPRGERDLQMMECRPAAEQKIPAIGVSGYQVAIPVGM
ncbi:hypothetical protein GCM10010464_64780 [Pseudonocardia yunnanensis]